MITSSKKLQSVLWILVSHICFILLTVLIKSLKDVPKPIILFIRNLVLLIFLIPLIVKKGIHNPLPKDVFWDIFKACIVLCALFSAYYAYQNLPLLL